MHPSPHQAPIRRVSGSFICVYAFAYTGIWIALLTPVIVTISLRVSELAPTRAAQNLALILSSGATCAMLAGPLFGYLSDRTRSRFGMRRPWMIGGILLGTLALLFVATAPTINSLLISWCLAQLAFNAALASVIALLADQIPSEQRGTVAGIMGVCMPLGQLIGTYIVQLVADSIVLAFMLPAAVGAIAVLTLAAVLRDRRLTDEPIVESTTTVARGIQSDGVARRNFWCAWLSRLLLGIGIAFLTTYQPLFLVATLDRPVSEVPSLMFRSMLLQSAIVIIASVAFGQLSDRLKRRKIFVLLGATIYAFGLWWIAGADSYLTFLIGIAVVSIAHGMYFAVDLALVADVLPNAQRDAAKDLGILNITNAMPQIVAPIVGAGILLLAHGSYAAMYVVAGMLAMLGAAALVPMRSR
jgi:MFS family permease